MTDDLWNAEWGQDCQQPMDRPGWGKAIPVRPVTDRPDWDAYFLGIARAVSARGDCTRRRVGAVLVRRDRTIASTGYNGAEPGGKSCLKGECPRGTKTLAEVAPGSSYDTGEGACIAIHAEMNCITYARESTVGYTLYLTCEPCDGCWRLIRGARLTRVVWPDGSLRLPN